MTVLIANWVNQATATTGTGTMTLGAAETGYTTFGGAGIPDGALVGYTIIDGSNKENGYGVYTASGTTLTRATVTATLVAGVYDDTAPVAITLSGAATVSIMPDARTNLVGMNGVKCLKTTDKFLRSANSGTATGTRIMVVGRTYYCQFLTYGPIEIASLGIEITTIATTGANMKLGIYRWDGASNSAQLIDSTADITTVGTIGQKTSALLGGNLVLPPGFYCLAVGSDSDVTFKAGVVESPYMFPSLSLAGTIVKALRSEGYTTALLASPSFDHNTTDTTFPDMFIIHE